MRGIPDGELTEDQRRFILEHQGVAQVAGKRYRAIWPVHRLEEFDDAVTDGLIRAAHSYDSGRGALESTWVYLCVLYMLRERHRGLIKGRLVGESQIQSQCVPWETIEESGECCSLAYSPVDARVEWLGLRESITELLSALTPYARTCLLAWASDEGLVAWAKAHGHNVRNTHQRRHAALCAVRRRVQRLSLCDPRKE